MDQGSYLKRARQKARMTQEHLAMAAEVSTRTIIRAEKNAVVSHDALRAICAALGITADDVPPLNSESAFDEAPDNEMETDRGSKTSILTTPASPLIGDVANGDVAQKHRRPRLSLILERNATLGQTFGGHLGVSAILATALLGGFLTILATSYILLFHTGRNVDLELMNQIIVKQVKSHAINVVLGVAEAYDDTPEDEPPGHRMVFRSVAYAQAQVFAPGRGSENPNAEFQPVRSSPHIEDEFGVKFFGFYQKWQPNERSWQQAIYEWFGVGAILDYIHPNNGRMLPRRFMDSHLLSINSNSARIMMTGADAAQCEMIFKAIPFAIADRVLAALSEGTTQPDRLLPVSEVHGCERFHEPTIHFEVFRHAAVPVAKENNE